MSFKYRCSQEAALTGSLNCFARERGGAGGEREGELFGGGVGYFCSLPASP
jgi:hypothetical protein